MLRSEKGVGSRAEDVLSLGPFQGLTKLGPEKAKEGARRPLGRQIA